MVIICIQVLVEKRQETRHPASSLHYTKYVFNVKKENKMRKSNQKREVKNNLYTKDGYTVSLTNTTFRFMIDV